MNDKTNSQTETSDSGNTKVLSSEEVNRLWKAGQLHPVWDTVSTHPKSRWQRLKEKSDVWLPKALTFGLGVLGLGADAISVAAATNRGSFFTLDELEWLCQQKPPTFIVDGLLPAGDVHVAVGDSGLGKTPWAYQLGLCVASGRKFLGQGVTQAPVLYYDMENGRQQILELGQSLCRFLEVEACPENFRIFTNDDDCPPIPWAVEVHKPGLVIVDSLRAYNQEAEMDNNKMADLLDELRATARDYGCAILLLHHVRKTNEIDRETSLENTRTIEWLQRASGARALVNQTNTRIALAAPERTDAAALVTKTFVKLQGETGQMYLERVCDEEGKPLGYKRLSRVGLLAEDEQAEYARLPREFRFKDAIAIFNRSADPTNKRLIKFMSLGLVEKHDGGYRKTDQPAENDRVDRGEP